MEHVLKLIEKWNLANKLFEWCYSFALVIIGIVYIIIQYVISKGITDSFFIGLLYGGSFILLIGIKWIQGFFKDNIIKFYDNLEKCNKLDISHFEKLIKKIFNNPLVLICGALYGIAVGMVPFILDVWSDSLILKVLLSIFLFVVNFLTGASLFSLIMLYTFLYKTSDYLVISLYRKNNPASNFITDLSKRASIIASLYIAFSITSIYLSKLPINFLTIGYSIFAGLIIVIAYLVPMIPIRNKILAQKRKLLDEISNLLENELINIISTAKSEKVISTKKYLALLELSNRISSIQTIPIGFKALWNSIYIILITFLPVFIQVILERFL